MLEKADVRLKDLNYFYLLLINTSLPCCVSNNLESKEQLMAIESVLGAPRMISSFCKQPWISLARKEITEASEKAIFSEKEVE